MKTKLVFVALGAIATLMLGNSTSAGATSNETDMKSKVEAAKVVTVKSGDTLEAIAKKHKTTYVRLFNANPKITHPDVIDVGDKITIPEKDKKLKDRFSKLASAAPVATTAPAAASAPTASAPAPQYTATSSASSSTFLGNGWWCTDYVHSKRPDVPIYGNAGYSWISAAQADGKSTGSTPRAGAVAVMDGHVAYVEYVNGDGSYRVSEMGWNYQAGNYNERTVQPGAFGAFIY